MIDNVFIGGKGLCYYVDMNYFIVDYFGKGRWNVMNKEKFSWNLSCRIYIVYM